MTDRDREIVRWIGRIGAVTVPQVMARFELCRTIAYSRIGACVEAGYVRRARLVYNNPALLVATTAGLRYARLELSPMRVSLSLAPHHLVCGHVAVWLERARPGERVVSVRELEHEERQQGLLIASATMGELPSGSPRQHRPDFAVLGAAGTEAIEVELTGKAPSRLDQILRAWKWARHVDRVTYLCPPGPTLRAVAAAIERTDAGDYVGLVSLEELSR